MATTGAEPLTYQWQLDDTNLVSSSEVSGITTNTLTINNVQESNEGMYRCVVTNDAGNTTSNAAQLTVCEWSWVAHQVLVIFRVCQCRNFSILVVHCSEPTYTRYMYVLAIDGFDGMWLSIQSIVLLRVAGLRPVKECYIALLQVVTWGILEETFYQDKMLAALLPLHGCGYPLKVVGPSHLKTILNPIVSIGNSTVYCGIWDKSQLFLHYDC